MSVTEDRITDYNVAPTYVHEMKPIEGGKIRPDALQLAILQHKDRQLHHHDLA
eukprot:COSAG02_NODE_25749_length_650_cov_0.647913_1_plen_53_part_00